LPTLHDRCPASWARFACGSTSSMCQRPTGSGGAEGVRGSQKGSAVCHLEWRCEGLARLLELREVDPPEVGDGEVLVRVHAASVNPADWHAMAGTPGSHARR
jgi:hypothetical protein